MRDFQDLLIRSATETQSFRCNAVVGKAHRAPASSEILGRRSLFQTRHGQAVVPATHEHRIQQWSRAMPSLPMIEQQEARHAPYRRDQRSRRTEKFPLERPVHVARLLTPEFMGGRDNGPAMTSMGEWVGHYSCFGAGATKTVPSLASKITDSISCSVSYLGTLLEYKDIDRGFSVSTCLQL